MMDGWTKLKFSSFIHVKQSRCCCCCFSLFQCLSLAVIMTALSLTLSLSLSTAAVEWMALESSSVTQNILTFRSVWTRGPRHHTHLKQECFHSGNQWPHSESTCDSDTHSLKITFSIKIHYNRLTDG